MEAGPAHLVDASDLLLAVQGRDVEDGVRRTTAHLAVVALDEEADVARLVESFEAIGAQAASATDDLIWK